MADTVITIDNLWKEYRLGAGGHGRLVKDLQSWWARKRGTDDPNASISSLDPKAAPSDRFWALQEVSFEAKEGEVIGIIGRNGAGKSTLLKILSRVTTPTRGEITITGRVASLLEVGTGFHPELTGRENVFLNGAILGMSRAEIRRKFDEIVAFSEVERFIDTPVKRYSSGMYVRLAFGVAAHLEPEILIIDEVLAVGDAQFQKKCLGKMEAVGREGRTVLFVSHNMPSVQKLCSRAVLLQQGWVVRDGAVAGVIGAYLNQSADDSLAWERAGGAAKPVSFRRVYALDRDGNRQAVVTTGEPLRVAVEFDVTEPSTLYRLAVALQDDMGTQILSTTADEAGIAIPSEPGTYRVSVSFPGVILLPKLYGLRLVLWRRLERHIDTIDAIRFIPEETLAPEEGHTADRKSLIAVACDWSPAAPVMLP